MTPRLQPPRRATRLLRRCLPGPRGDEVSDDLAELFALKHEQHGRLRASLRYWLDVLSICVRRRLHERPPYEQTSGIIMWRNYWTTAQRQLRKHKGYAALNIIGLAVGLAAALLMLLFVQDEYSYDRFHQDADRVFRVVQDLEAGGDTRLFTGTPPAFMPAFKAAMPEVGAGFRTVVSGGQVRHEGEVYSQSSVYYVGPDIFEVMTFPLLEGRADLTRPYTMVLTASAAARYFGEASPVGQTLVFGDAPHEVTGVIADVPSQSHFRPEVLVSFATYQARRGSDLSDTWGQSFFYSYFRLADGAEAETVQAKLPAFVEETVAPHLRPGVQYRFHLQPITSIHLHSHRLREIGVGGDATTVRIFLLIAGFVLLIACINFVNLRLARATQRFKEVGLRKVLGAQRPQLVGQFLGESLLIVGVAMVGAILLVALGLPQLNELAQKSIAFAGLFQGGYLLAALGLVLGVGLLAGGYPALYLSALRPVAALKGGWQRGRQRGVQRLRQGLVVVQFALSLFLLIGTAVVYDQLTFMQTRNLGFQPEQVVLLPYDADRFPAFKEALLQDPSVLSVAATSGGGVPGRMTTTLSYHAEGMAEDATSPILGAVVDPSYVTTYGLQVLAGRDFEEARATDVEGGILLNEAALRSLGWTPEEAIGKAFALSPYSRNGRVVGVVQDFHFASLHSPIEPLALAIWPQWFSRTSVRIATEEVSQTLDHLAATWAQLFPERPFNYTFLDEDFERLYAQDARFGTIISFFAGLSLLIACLGLFGLAAFMAQQRTKELGIRKVLGASVPGLVLLLARSFVVLIGGAMLVALPVAFFAMRGWLATFAYHTTLSPMLFMGAALLVLVLALLTISYQAIRAALRNPVQTLRYE